MTKDWRDKKKGNNGVEGNIRVFWPYIKHVYLWVYGCRLLCHPQAVQPDHPLISSPLHLQMYSILLNQFESLIKKKHTTQTRSTPMILFTRIIIFYGQKKCTKSTNYKYITSTSVCFKKTKQFIVKIPKYPLNLMHRRCFDVCLKKSKCIST